MPASAQQDFRFAYLKGNALYLKAALTDPNHWNPPLPLSPTMAQGLQILKAAAARLPSLDAACAVEINAYSILNTIGAFYLNRGYFKDAQNYLLQAYANDSKVTPDTKRKIRDNLGTVYLVQREPDPAIRYYTEALTFHSTVASTQIAKALALKSARVPPLIMK
jgi:Tfp pilus assembly protein PilF